MIVSNFTNYNSGCHVVPIHDEFAVEACALAIVEIDLLSWKRSSLWYWQHLHATRGGICLSCAGSSWLPLPLVSFPSFSLLPTPNRPCQSERSSKARHEADSFEPAEWSERLTPGQSGWLGAVAVGSIPALALSLFLQYQKIRLECAQVAINRNRSMASQRVNHRKTS